MADEKNKTPDIDITVPEPFEFSNPVTVTLDSGETLTLPDQLEDLKRMFPETWEQLWAIRRISNLNLEVSVLDLTITALQTIENTIKQGPEAIIKNQEALLQAGKTINNVLDLFPEIKDDMQQRESGRKTIETIERHLRDVDTQKDLHTLELLLPYIDRELKKRSGDLMDFNEAFSRDFDENGHLKKGSPLETAINAAIDAKLRTRQMTEGRKAAAKQKALAEQKNAIMELKGGQYPMFSSKQLWDAFSPDRICELGTLDKNRFLDKETGLIHKTRFDNGELQEISANTIPLTAVWLLTAISANSVEDLRKTPVESPVLKFYVSGVLKTLSSDPRQLLDPKIISDNQLDFNRKTAGVLYLENLFQPLTNLIGKIGESRYSVFNYIGYDANSDTMEIQLPYIYQLMQITQKEYFEAAENRRALEAERTTKRRPGPIKKDFAPLKLNRFFINSALNEDAKTLEIALYITNLMLAAGKPQKGRTKKTEATFQTVINNCPRLKERLQEIKSGPSKNKLQLINTELRRFERAYNLIMNPEKCRATEYFDFHGFQPTKTEKGRTKFIAPTSTRLKDKIIITWSIKAQDHDEE